MSNFQFAMLLMTLILFLSGFVVAFLGQRHRIRAQEDIIDSLMNQIAMLDWQYWQYKAVKGQADIFEETLKKHQESTTNG